MKKISCVLLGIGSFVWAAGYASAASKEFDFKDPKSVNSIIFVLDSTLEPIMGIASGISGTVNFDPSDAKATTGKIVLNTASLHIENKGMKDTLHGADWLDVKKHPTIEFAFKKVTEVKTPKPDEFEMTVLGDLTCKGTTKEIPVTVSATYLPDKLGERTRQASGDLLILRSKFTIKRKDFDIKPDMSDKVVAEDIEVRASIAGGAAKK